MQKLPVLLLALASVVMMPLQTLADSVKLTSGDTLEGTIIEQSDAQVVMDVQVSDSIIDRRTIPVEEIEEVDATQPDEAAFEEIEAVTLGDNSKSAKFYQRFIDAKLKAFLRDYPESSHKPDVEAKLDEFTVEYERVKNGEVKFNGEWLSAEESEEKAGELAAIRELEEMKASVQARDVIGALNTYEGIVTEHGGTQAFPEAAELAQKILQSLKKTLANRIPMLEREQKEWEEGVLLAREVQQVELRKARENEMARYTAAVELAEKDPDIKWPPLFVRSEKSLTSLKQKTDQALSAMERLDISAMQASVAATRKAESALESEKFEEALAAIKDAKAKWSGNDLANMMTEEIETAAEEYAATEELASQEAVAQAEEDKAAAEAAAKQAKAAEQAAAAEQAGDAGINDEKPFYKTVKGAAAILVALILVVGILTLFSGKSRKESKVE